MKKRNNDLILVKSGDKKHYFTTKTLAGYFLAMAPASVDWAIKHKNVIKNNRDEDVTVEIVDGTHVEWCNVNNI